MRTRSNGDLFGEACRRYFERGIDTTLRVEEKNGTTYEDFPASYYVESRRLRKLEREFLELARGKTLDLGCGSGRIGTYLRKRGIEFYGLEKSEDMKLIAEARGIPVYKMDFNQELPKGIVFDTVLMLGNGFGSPGSVDAIINLLKRLRFITSDNAFIIAESTDSNKFTDEELEANLRNETRGLYKGYRRVRTFSNGRKGLWEDWVHVDPDLLNQICSSTDWTLVRGPSYDGDEESYFFALQKA